MIRSWISSRGRSIHLEIDGVEVFRRSVRIQEHRWYHICQSWENRVGRYALWLDGHLELQGRLEEVEIVLIVKMPTYFQHKNIFVQSKFKRNV